MNANLPGRLGSRHASGTLVGGSDSHLARKLLATNITPWSTISKVAERS